MTASDSCRPTHHGAPASAQSDCTEDGGVGRVASIEHDLLRKEAYPPDADDGAVQLVETHSAWVFLRKHDAFKVKKPVSLGFLDFHTIEQREAACRAEIVLNRRLAPDVYLDVVPVRLGATGSATFVGDGPIADWAVHMVRLPDKARADLLLDAGRLTIAMVERLAERIAAFHEACSSDPATQAFGTPSAIRKNLEENFEQTLGLLPTYLQPSEARTLLAWQRQFLVEHGAWFLRRIARGAIRDGHGDLRLEHAYLEGERVTVIDCVEFATRYRAGDVALDVAFLSMDLASRGRVDLAERFLAVYARETSDFDLYRGIDFYESYRAYVRAKVASIIASDKARDGEARARAQSEARRYYMFALSSSRRPAAVPCVVAVTGLIAAGKSTIAEQLSVDLGAPAITADRLRKAMLGVRPTQNMQQDAWSGAYEPDFTARVYDRLLESADCVLCSGRAVVLDASFRSKALRARVIALARAHGVSCLFVECRAPREVCSARLAAREGHRVVSDGRLDVYDEFAARFEPLTELLPAEHCVVDTTVAVSEAVAAVREHLSMWPGCDL